ncbi:hypothetical protein Sjap_003865 [Stephania japonica]|uniref:Uncharacterized protein n=1 Tax=Stephania japonica TaxID=461633 RepID=A0AAP0PVF4_9MAGN
MARLFVLEAVENGSKVAAVFQFHGSLSFLCIIALTLSLISMAIFACAETGKKRKRHGSYAGAGTAGAFNGGVIVTDGGGHHHHGGGGGWWCHHVVVEAAGEVEVVWWRRRLWRWRCCQWRWRFLMLIIIMFNIIFAAKTFDICESCLCTDCSSLTSFSCEDKSLFSYMNHDNHKSIYIYILNTRNRRNWYYTLMSV